MLEIMLWNGKRRLSLQTISFLKAKYNILYICFVYFKVPGIGPLKSAFSSHRHVALGGRDLESILFFCLNIQAATNLLIKPTKYLEDQQINIISPFICFVRDG
jgi:hypothetical protein